VIASAPETFGRGFDIRSATDLPAEPAEGGVWVHRREECGEEEGEFEFVLVAAGRVATGEVDYGDQGRAHVVGKGAGLARVCADTDRRLLGAEMCGSRAAAPASSASSARPARTSWSADRESEKPGSPAPRYAAASHD
jgi:hypothetical protein